MSNYPLRGGKGTLFEGGVKGASFVHGWGLKNVAGTRNKGMLHAADWYLTLANVTGARIPEHTRVRQAHVKGSETRLQQDPSPSPATVGPPLALSAQVAPHRPLQNQRRMR